MAVIQDIPKLYTALAEWLSCLLFILLLPRRRAALLTAGILAAALACLAAIQLFLGVGPISLWIPGMMLAAAVMYGTICLCCRVHTRCGILAVAGLYFRRIHCLTGMADLFLCRAEPDGEHGNAGGAARSVLRRELSPYV